MKIRDSFYTLIPLKNAISCIVIIACLTFLVDVDFRRFPVHVAPEKEEVRGRHHGEEG